MYEQNIDLGDSSPNEVHPQLAGSSVEFFVAFEVSAHVHIEDVNLHVIAVFLLEQDSILQGIHATKT